MKILFQGDSITDCGRGNCGGAGYNNQGLGPGYPCLVASRLMCDHPEKELTFVNRGISGNKIVDLYARWKRDALNLEPDVISILIGVNDTWHELEAHDGVDVPRFERIYRELLQWTVDVLPKVKLVLIDPFTFPETRPRFVAEVAERDHVVAKLAKEFNAYHIEGQKLFDEAFKRAPEVYWSADGAHPTPAGHQLLTDAWVKATADLWK